MLMYHCTQYVYIDNGQVEFDYVKDKICMFVFVSV